MRVSSIPSYILYVFLFLLMRKFIGFELTIVMMGAFILANQQLYVVERKKENDKDGWLL